MKKTASFLLALAASMTMGINSFATEPVETTVNNQSVQVNASYIEVTPAVYSIDLSWTAMNFTYVGDSKGTWNPDTCEYENPVEGGWTEDSIGKITITNNSNVYLDLSLWSSTTCNDAKILLQRHDSKYWDTRVNHATVGSLPQNIEDGQKDPNYLTTVVYTVKPSGTLPENMSDSQMGKISIMIRGKSV